VNDKAIGYDAEDEIESSRAPLLDHLVELRTRLIICVGAIAVAFGVCFAFVKPIFLFLVRPFTVAEGLKAVQDAGGHHGSFDLILALIGVKKVPAASLAQITLQATAPLEQFFTNIKLAAFGAIFEPDAAAVEQKVAVDAGALKEVDMLDVGALPLKRLLKNEWKELVHEDIGPGLLKAAVAAGVLILLNFLATWWAVRSAHYIYQPGGDVAAMQTQLDAQAAQLQEVLALLKATQGTCGGGSP